MKITKFFLLIGILLFTSNLLNAQVEVSDDEEVEYEVIEQPKDENIFLKVEVQPEFPEGIDSLHTYLKKNLNYPSGHYSNGKVYVKFVVVTETGEITRAQVVKGIGASFDEEAVRIVESMPNWIPGRQNGKPVAVWYTLPFSFSLK